jgi:hypothetical protein
LHKDRIAFEKVEIVPRKQFLLKNVNWEEEFPDIFIKKISIKDF